MSALPPGVEKDLIEEGDGPLPERGNVVTVHCIGYGKGGDLNEKFWSTKDPGQEQFSFTIGMGQVIPAWDLGVMTMKVGERATITTNAENAYGSAGFPSWGIGPDSTLKFELEVLSVEPGLAVAQ